MHLLFTSDIVRYQQHRTNTMLLFTESGFANGLLFFVQGKHPLRTQSAMSLTTKCSNLRNTICLVNTNLNALYCLHGYFNTISESLSPGILADLDVMAMIIIVKGIIYDYLTYAWTHTRASQRTDNC